jgi:hypothetical protein
MQDGELSGTAARPAVAKNVIDPSLRRDSQLIPQGCES